MLLERPSRRWGYDAPYVMIGCDGSCDDPPATINDAETYHQHMVIAACPITFKPQRYQRCTCHELPCAWIRDNAIATLQDQLHETCYPRWLVWCGTVIGFALLVILALLWPAARWWFPR